MSEIIRSGGVGTSVQPRASGSSPMALEPEGSTTYNTAGDHTFTYPAGGVSRVRVRQWAPGGGGAGGTDGDTIGGGGGGGGEMCEGWIIGSPGQTFTVHNGAIGTGGAAATNGTDATNSTCVGAGTIAVGGKHGVASNGTTGVGGVGGTGGTGNRTLNGGTGASVLVAQTPNGGGGGSSAGTLLAGTSPATHSSVGAVAPAGGGDGGAGGTAGAATAGASPGGGGGGGKRNVAGAAGGVAVSILEWGSTVV